MGAELPSVLVLYNSPGCAGGTAPESEAGVLAEVAAVEAALERLGARRRTVGVESLEEVPTVLAAAGEEVVFNLVEGFAQPPKGGGGGGGDGRGGGARDACLVPALCAASGKGCTGSDTECLLLALDKWRTKAVLRAAEVPVPDGVCVPPGAPLRAEDLPEPPYIVKPVRADASEGIHGTSSVFTDAGEGLREAVARVHALGQAALVERLVGRRELNVAILERAGNPRLLPVAEIDFSLLPPGSPPIVDYAAKWLPDSSEYHSTPRILPAPLPEGLARRVRELALAAWEALGCSDYARVDLRLDEGGKPCVLEVNPNPDVSPEAGFTAALAAGGIAFDEFVATVVRNAAARAGAGSAAVPPPRRRPPEGLTIRYTRREDREAVLALVEATGFFRPAEVEVAREVLDAALAGGEGGHYQSFAACLGGRVVGWVCFGPTPCTEGTFDIYWIAVAREQQGKGIGAALMEYAEGLIAARGGRLAVVETSGRPDYEPTRRFYLGLGYREASRVRDFYAPGDDKVVYTKRLG